MCADNDTERLLLWKTCERPLDWERRFGRSAPLEVEIGFGGGDWLVSSARKRPAHNFVGIDAQWPSVKRGLRKLRTGDVQNVRVIMTDAQVALQRLFRPRSIQRISSLFPCPWPKKRHIKHRLFSRRFLTLANTEQIKIRFVSFLIISK